jgi:protoporphyrinogen oxidase
MAAARPGPGSDHVLVLGAGPAGLSAAYELTRHGTPVTILEKDPRQVGGIARTVEFEGCRFDVGPHRFFSKSAEIEAFWTEILGDEMLEVDRLTRILYGGRYFAYPLRVANAFLNLGPIETARCLASYAAARVRPHPNPHTFEEWVRNQFGSRLFRIFFKTYTEKVWGISTSELSADWAAQRIKGLNMLEVVRNALAPALPPFLRGGDHAVVKTLIDQFRYPRRGAGQMWEAVAARLAQSGATVHLGQEVVAVRHHGGRVRSVQVEDATGARLDIIGSHVISTMPIRELIGRLDPKPPAPVIAAANALGYRDFVTVDVVVDSAQVFPDQWIYVHDPTVKVGRIANFKNFSAAMVPGPEVTGLGMEYFCFEGDGLWSASDTDLLALARGELAQLRICRPEQVRAAHVVRQRKAYPVYDDYYKGHLALIREYLGRQLPNLHLVGRNGMHKYNNQDHSMMTGLLAARNIATGTRFDPWKVNTDAEYHEEERADDRSGRLMPERLAS